MNKALALAVALVASAGSLVAVSTAPTAATAALRSPDEVMSQITQLTARGVPDDQIASRLALTQVSQGGQVPPAAASNVSLVPPKMWRDRSGIYYLKTGWGFTHHPDGSKPVGFGVPVGGPEGFAFSLDHRVINRGGKLYICPKHVSQYMKCFYATNYWDNSSYGQAWKFQDRTALAVDNYSTWSGIAVFAFTPPPGCIQAFSRYTHTWSSTSVTGVSIGRYSIGFSWSSSSHYWQRTSEAGHYRC